MISFHRALVLLVLSFTREAIAGSATTLSIEPYLAEWCAEQFSDQLTNFNGYSMAKMVKNRDYVRIEPYLGKYCFDQFPTELKDQQETLTIANMAKKHVQVEPYLKEWGDVSFASLTNVALEPYVARWCARGQFRRVFSNPNESLNNAEANGHVKIETAFGRWCFAQFPDEFYGLDEDSTVEALASDHTQVENHLIKWEAAEYNFLKIKPAGATKTEKAILGTLISLIIVSVLLIAFFCWRRRTAAAAKQFDRDVQMVDSQIKDATLDTAA